jgi:hypothetical protein
LNLHDKRTVLLVVFISLASASAVAGQNKPKNVIEEYNVYRAEVARHRTSQECPDLNSAATAAANMLVLAVGNPELAGERAGVIQVVGAIETRRKSICARPNPRPGEGIRGAGGSFEKTRTVQDLALATLHMRIGERERFVASLSEESKREIAAWLILNESFANNVVRSFDGLNSLRVAETEEMIRKELDRSNLRSGSGLNRQN